MIGIIRDTNEEVRSWAELSSFRAEILSVPWHVPEDVEKALLREARGEIKRTRRDPSEAHRRKMQKEKEAEAKKREKEQGHKGVMKRKAHEASTHQSGGSRREKRRTTKDHGGPVEMIDLTSPSTSADFSENRHVLPPTDQQEELISSQGRKIRPRQKGTYLYASDQSAALL